MLYYMAADNQRLGPFTVEQMREHGLSAETLVWRDGMPDWQTAGQLPELRMFIARSAPSPGGPPPPIAPLTAREYLPQPAFDRSDVNSKKIAAGICGILLGALGIHKFVLGFTGAGIITLIITFATCGIGGAVMHVIGMIEGIIYLTHSDEEFYQLYVVQKKEWF